MERMPTIIRGANGEGVDLSEHAMPTTEWIAVVRKWVGQDLNRGEMAYAKAMGEHYGWTARVCADAIIRHRAADAEYHDHA